MLEGLAGIPHEQILISVLENRETGELVTITGSTMEELDRKRAILEAVTKAEKAAEELHNRAKEATERAQVAETLLEQERDTHRQRLDDLFLRLSAANQRAERFEGLHRLLLDKCFRYVKEIHKFGQEGVVKVVELWHDGDICNPIYTNTLYDAEVDDYDYEEVGG